MTIENAPKKTSKNQEASRPNRSFTLDRDVIEALNKIPNREKSAFVEDAILTHLHDRQQRKEATAELVAASQYLMETAGNRDAELQQIRQMLAAVGDQLAFQTTVIERLFGVKRAYEPFIIPENEFTQNIKDAYAAYAASPELLTPKLERDTNPLEDAARQQAYRQLLDYAKSLIESQPFMTDERFYCAHTFGGWGVFDRKFQGQAFMSEINGEPYAHREHDDFLVFSVSYFGTEDELHISFPKTRPYFQLSRSDYRETAFLAGEAEVVEAMALIAADYLAYRRFDTVEDGKKPSSL